LTLASGALQELGSFFAYDPGFRNGLFVAAGGGRVITGVDVGGGPHVRAFTAAGAPAGVSFFAYSLDFRGGVHVATGNVVGDGSLEIITGPGPGGGPHVQAFTLGGVPTSVGFIAY
jgi:hypothetical protein